jgi:hypothetical protein
MVSVVMARVVMASVVKKVTRVVVTRVVMTRVAEKMVSVVVTRVVVTRVVMASVAEKMTMSKYAALKGHIVTLSQMRVVKIKLCQYPAKAVVPMTGSTVKVVNSRNSKNKSGSAKMMYYSVVLINFV